MQLVSGNSSSISWLTLSRAENVSLGSSDVSLAVSRVRSNMAFAGLTERWAESVCLFHRIWGGVPRAESFANTRMNANRRVPVAQRYDDNPDCDGLSEKEQRQCAVGADGQYKEDLLGGVKDLLDLEVYEEVTRWWLRATKLYVCA